MLKDQVRTTSYQRAIEGNREDFRDKIVLDIGAGTGILSIFAAKSGAKHVYAIENAEIAHFAQEIIRKNGLADKITVIKGKMEEIELPVKEVDIIISEWMGYFLTYESMLDSVLWARDKYLKAGGKMLPDRAQVFISTIEDE
jgi:protein arginine N-methyltransferase 1